MITLPFSWIIMGFIIVVTLELAALYFLFHLALATKQTEKQFMIPENPRTIKESIPSTEKKKPKVHTDHELWQREQDE